MEIVCPSAFGDNKGEFTVTSEIQDLGRTLS